MRDLRQMEVLTQKGAACGTTCLAMVIRFLTKDSSITPENIDREIRRLPGMFSAPVDLITYARRKGLQSEEYNHSSLEQVEELVTQGIPVMPLLDLTPNNALDFDQWHWVVVVGVDKTDGQKVLLINNPWGQQEEWGQERFSKEWTCLRLLRLTFGYNNYLIAIGTPGDSLPPCCAEGVGPANAVTKGLADVVNGFATVRRNHSLRGLGGMLGGAFIFLYGMACIVKHNICHRAKSIPKT